MRRPASAPKPTFSRHINVAQPALARIYHQAWRREVPVVPIPGTRRRSLLEENLGASNRYLSAAEIVLLGDVVALRQCVAV